MPPLIELRDVTRVYRQGGILRSGKTVRAVDGVSLAIEPGRRVAVVGASGSGKSTLGRLILGLERPDSGDVLFRGESMLRPRREVQAVFQNSHGAVNPRFTAGAIIGEPLKNFYGMKGPALGARAEELLLRVGLRAEDGKKYPHQFSGGELQRICLARALAPEPELIVLDEAVSSLDAAHQARILRLLAGIGEEKKCAFVFISHDPRTAKNFADSVVTMKNGKTASPVSPATPPA